MLTTGIDVDASKSRNISRLAFLLFYNKTIGACCDNEPRLMGIFASERTGST